jgi:hypothetical protein
VCHISFGKTTGKERLRAPQPLKLIRREDLFADEIDKLRGSR